MRFMEKIAACQISFIPIGDRDYLENIRKVLKILEESGLEIKIGALSTEVRGEKNKVLNLIATLYQHMDDICKFTMDVKISNLCGC